MSDSMFDRVKFNSAPQSFRATSLEELMDRVEGGAEILDSVAENLAQDVADADDLLPQPRLRPDMAAWYRFVEASDLVRQMKGQGR